MSLLKDGNYHNELQKLGRLVEHCIELVEEDNRIFSSVSEFASSLIGILNTRFKTDDVLQFITDYCNELIKYVDENTAMKILENVKSMDNLVTMLRYIRKRNISVSINQLEKILYRCIFNNGTPSVSLENAIIFITLRLAKISDYALQKLIVWVIKAYYTKCSDSSLISIGDYTMGQLKTKFTNTNEWNNMIIQFAETKAEYIRLIMGDVDMRTLLRLIAINPSVFHYLPNEIQTEIKDVHNIGL